MTQNERIKKLESYLEGYRLYRTVKALADTGREDPVLTAEMAMRKMREIRAFVSDLPNGREKIFLHCHYIADRNMEECADMLGVSLRSVYRIRMRALKLALCYFYHEKAAG